MMLQSQDSLIVKVLKQRIQAITPVEQMIVFGSRACGDAAQDSDLDVFIELPELSPSLRKQILEIAWEISFEYEVIISVFLTSTLLLENSPLAANPILKAILPKVSLYKLQGAIYRAYSKGQ